jgi:hypothetical protein
MRMKFQNSGLKGRSFVGFGMNMNLNMNLNANNHREVLYSELQKWKGHSSP